MKFSIMEPNLGVLCERIYSYETENGKLPRYIVMSSNMRDIINFYNKGKIKTTRSGDETYVDKIFEIDIAINESLCGGEVELVG